MSDDEILELRIAKRVVLATDVVGLELVSADGSPLPVFEAGSHVDVHVASGVVRQYSLCNDPVEQHRYRLGILRDPVSRGGSEGAHRFAVGQTLRISRPRCNFRLVDRQRRALLFAGGIGVTPLLSMAWQLSRGAVPFELHYCTRSADRTAFAGEIGDAPFASMVHLHRDDGPFEQRLNLDAILVPREPDTHLYICGPGGFIDFVTAGAHARGWTADQIHVERFTADVDATGDTFSVHAAVSNVTVVVGPKETIVHALARVGVDVPVSCEQGVCGTCLTRVIEGRPDHRDMYQTDEEKAANTQMTLCCSRSLDPRLVVEI